VTDQTAPEEEPELAGAGGDDVSAGTSVSGVGGEALRTENEDAGLRPVHEQGERIGWGKDAREVGAQAAPNDGTGQSERPTD
jgi:hypothetical protein